MARYGTGFFEETRRKIDPHRSGFEFNLILELGTVRSSRRDVAGCSLHQP